MNTELEEDDVDADPGVETGIVFVMQGIVHFAEWSPGSRSNISKVSEVVTIVAEYLAASSRAFRSFPSNLTAGAKAIVGGRIRFITSPFSLFSMSLSETSGMFASCDVTEDSDDRTCDVEIV
mmetsp:Transcript_899/g.1892  ORF Transcript_899/g.1892 Transcript_899/m.1892 type:complete len:122 (+) Transcript_899:1206-1571(+)